MAFINFVEKLRKNIQKNNSYNSFGQTPGSVRVLKSGVAMRVIFYYPGEEGTYIENPEVTLFENGILHIKSNQEETTTHLQNCEVLWKFAVEEEDLTNKVRLINSRSSNLKEASKDQHSDLAGTIITDRKHNIDKNLTGPELK